ncbi:transposase [Leifsonia xyli subsp. xyli str. CTCB07]|uniref:Transposase n=1 Tax=Leifsonia xyli subsp. xyli (strain CTCB07) TaxID=281090 RepID=Q6AER1_LEIXX|nr:transposase [Leifsonia xyli subsp. xyli str. CTCB07]
MYSSPSIAPRASSVRFSTSSRLGSQPSCHADARDWRTAFRCTSSSCTNSSGQRSSTSNVCMMGSLLAGSRFHSTAHPENGLSNVSGRIGFGSGFRDGNRRRVDVGADVDRAVPQTIVIGASRPVYLDSLWVLFCFFLLEDGVMPGSYPDEFRQRALRMLSEARSDHKTDHAVIKHVAGKLGVNAETLRLWKKRLDVDEGRQPGPRVRRRRRSSV